MGCFPIQLTFHRSLLLAATLVFAISGPASAVFQTTVGAPNEDGFVPVTFANPPALLFRGDGPAPPQPPPNNYFVNLGGFRDYIDSDGETWEADIFAATGTAVSACTSFPFSDYDRPPVYCAYRTWPGQADSGMLSLPVSPGEYHLTLYFSETTALPGERLLNLFVEGDLIFPGLDISLFLGTSSLEVPYGMIPLIVQGPITDGALDLLVQATVGDPTLAAIRLIKTADLTGSPTVSPTAAPVDSTTAPTTSPTTGSPSNAPTTLSPTAVPTFALTTPPTSIPTITMTGSPTTAPTTLSPTAAPTLAPTTLPTSSPTITVTGSPTKAPTTLPPTIMPTTSPTVAPTTAAPTVPTATASPTTTPTTTVPTPSPTSRAPTASPTSAPTTPTATGSPTAAPTTMAPTTSPTSRAPTASPTSAPTTPTATGSPTTTPTTMAPTTSPTSSAPTTSPTGAPTVPTATGSPTAAPTTMAPTTSPTSRAPTTSPTGAPTVPTATGSPTAAPTTTAPTSSPTAVITSVPTNVTPTTPTPGGFAMRIDAGTILGEVDPNGNAWMADTYYTGGRVFKNCPLDIADTDFDFMYCSERWGTFRYDIPVPAGKTYRVTVHLAEINFQNSNQRVFRVNVNGVKSDNLDLVSLVGYRTGYTGIQMIVEDIDGMIEISTEKVVQNPKISGIEIIEVDSTALSPTESPSVAPVASVSNQNFDLRINSGSFVTQVDLSGNAWLPDGPYANGGGSYSSCSSPISGGESFLFCTERYGTGSPMYNIPVPSPDTQSDRVFNVQVNDQMAANIDVVAEVGPRAAYSLEFNLVQVTSSISISLIEVRGNPKISGIHISELDAGFIPPTAAPTVDSGVAALINCGGAAYTDSIGRLWSADSFSSGGSTFSAAGSIANTVDDELYQSERWGQFEYNIPVANGNYDVTLHFAELFFAAANQRLFDIVVEGSAMSTDVDVFAQAGNQNLAAVQITFTGVSVTDGFLTISMVNSSPKVNNPKLSAIEVIDA